MGLLHSFGFVKLFLLLLYSLFGKMSIPLSSLVPLCWLTSLKSSSPTKKGKRGPIFPPSQFSPPLGSVAMVTRKEIKECRE